MGDEDSTFAQIAKIIRQTGIANKFEVKNLRSIFLDCDRLRKVTILVSVVSRK
jgi:hypothetical protein